MKLLFLFQKKFAPVPILANNDPVDREIDFVPTKTPYDPRWMLAGRPNPENPEIWQSGFFDKGSWMEIMAPWAQTVVCGRARSVFYIIVFDGGNTQLVFWLHVSFWLVHLWFIWRIWSVELFEEFSQFLNCLKKLAICEFFWRIRSVFEIFEEFRKFLNYLKELVCCEFFWRIWSVVNLLLLVVNCERVMLSGWAASRWVLSV